MKQSALFVKTRREDPKDEVSLNAKLLIRAGYINKEIAGVYSFLPLGLRVLNKINDIIRREMIALGGQEVSLSSLQNADLWKKTGRWQDEVLDVWFKTKLKDGSETALAPTHEEPLTNLLRNHFSSYKDLPQAIFQFQTKFRNEERAKNGLLRTREFLMKDLYSFHASESDLDDFYQRAQAAYQRIYATVGLGDNTFMTFASGGSFSKYSHEFQTVCAAGEDTIYLSRDKKIAVNKEVYQPDVLAELGLTADDLIEEKAVEVGNIFKLANKYSAALGLNFIDDKGDKKDVLMGCYGIGPARLMATVVETMADERGLVWPQTIAPFAAHLILLLDDGGQVLAAGDKLAAFLEQAGIEVLVDDRELSAGEKFADADLLGCPFRLVISAKTLAANNLIECKNRRTAETVTLSASELLTLLKK